MLDWAQNDSFLEKVDFFNPTCSRLWQHKKKIKNCFEKEWRQDSAVVALEKLFQIVYNIFTTQNDFLTNDEHKDKHKTI